MSDPIQTSSVFDDLSVREAYVLFFITQYCRTPPGVDEVLGLPRGLGGGGGQHPGGGGVCLPPLINYQFFKLQYSI